MFGVVVNFVICAHVFHNYVMVCISTYVAQLFHYSGAACSGSMDKLQTIRFIQFCHNYDFNCVQLCILTCSICLCTWCSHRSTQG